MTKLQQKRLQFLNDTVNHFNSNNRGVLKSGVCSYVMGCAIGRHLTPELAANLELSNFGVAHPKMFKQLPENLQELGKDFLHYVQSLHDDERNWNESGLSDLGKEKVDNIKQMFILSIPLK